ncbi:transporter substrate-binding domain-containing protein [Pelagibius sp. Alg239-R121]|uniref:transporter substrate-binding domain-containing protein n=1 Tax=Pelagibius sp. Alg239-R121 TaxID=2993448 RepID=UPI0024A6B5F0|nr:transporter substrate-binding domain-containing protein [Pelagibius sp. Alg239-R121]
MTKLGTWLLRSIAVIAAVFTLGLSHNAEAQSTWEAIQASGKLRMGVTQAPPWYSKNPTTGEWDSGLIVSVGKSMAEDMGVELETVEVTWATAIAALQANKIDMMFLDATPKRALVVDYPFQPLLYISLAVLARDDLPAERWEDLNKADVKVAVPQATSMDAFLTRNIPNADIQRFPDNGAALAAFQSGRVDAVSLFHPPLLAARKKFGAGKLVIPTPAFSSPSSMAVRREADKTFRDWISHTIYYYYETGRTQRWYEEFLTEFGLDPKASPVIQRELLFAR